MKQKMDTAVIQSKKHSMINYKVELYYNFELGMKTKTGISDFLYKILK